MNRTLLRIQRLHRRLCHRMLRHQTDTPQSLRIRQAGLPRHKTIIPVAAHDDPSLQRLTRYKRQHHPVRLHLHILDHSLTELHACLDRTPQQQRIKLRANHHP